MTAGRRRGRATICVDQSSSTIANAIGDTLSNLGAVHAQLGELEQVRVTLQRAFAIFECFLGPDHARSARARSILESIAPSANRGV